MPFVLAWLHLHTCNTYMEDHVVTMVMPINAHGVMPDFSGSGQSLSHIGDVREYVRDRCWWLVCVYYIQYNTCMRTDTAIVQIVPQSLNELQWSSGDGTTQCLVAVSNVSLAALVHWTGVKAIYCGDGHLHSRSLLLVGKVSTQVETQVETESKVIGIDKVMSSMTTIS